MKNRFNNEYSRMATYEELEELRLWILWYKQIRLFNKVA
jgi:hypothetical protein